LFTASLLTQVSEQKKQFRGEWQIFKQEEEYPIPPKQKDTWIATSSFRRKVSNEKL
jgi:hypothetical protein